LSKIDNKVAPANSSLAQRIKHGFFPIVAGTALFLTYPSLVSYQDMATLAKIEAGIEVPSGTRWLASVSQVPGISQLMPNSTADAALPDDGLSFDQMATGSLTPEGEAIAEHVITEVRTGRKPQQVNRAQKGDRVVSASAKRPPDHFSAGSVLERHSMFAPLDVGGNVELAFVKAKPPAEALQVAAAFHPKKKIIDRLAPKADLPVMVASLVRESVPNILAYSPEPKLQRSPFAAILEDNTPLNIVPRLGEGDHRWAAKPLPRASFSAKQQRCLTAGIYFEARGEPVRGQAAVSQVILNRVKNPSYPDSICGVVYQNKHWRNRCQFSFACDRIKDAVRDKKRWKIAEYVARETTEGRIWLKEVGSSTHYHATYVSPKWARSMKKVGRIGLHIFYRTFGGGWS